MQGCDSLAAQFEDDMKAEGVTLTATDKVL